MTNNNTTKELLNAEPNAFRIIHHAAGYDFQKIKTTRAYIQNTSDIVFATGYCDLYYIFHDTQPTYYNCGVYGWNWDGYKEYQNGKTIAFITGYRNTTGKWIAPEILNKYTEKAKQIINNNRWNDYETTANELAENRKQFINELLNA